MANPTQFEFTLREVTEILIKKQDIHEGKWMGGFEFVFGATHIGQDPKDLKPSALVQINKVLLIKQPEGMADDFTLLVDAAKVNPAPTVRKSTKGK